jgi:hypothetical protein
MSPLAGRAVKGASLFDGGRGQYYTDLVCACEMVLFTLGDFDIAHAYVVGR